MIFDRRFVSDTCARYRNRLLAATVLTGAALLPSAAHAQSTWGGVGSTTSNSNYHTGTNWSTNPVAPIAAGSSAIFDITGSTVVGVTAPHTTDSWTFNAASQSYTVIGSAVTFSNAATLTNNANAGQAISIANDMTGTFLSQSGASTLTLSGTNSFTGTNLAGGTLVNNGSLTSTITSTASSTFTNNSTVTGTVTLANVGNTFNNNSPGTVSGLVISGGTANNSGTLNGGLNNGGVFSNSGTVNSGLTDSGTFGQTAGSTNGGTTNTGTVNASGGAINGAIDNNAGGIFNIGGTVTSNTTFNNSTATSRLLVNSGTYTVTGLVTNSGTNAGGAISVSAGATLTANGGITNNNNARIVNNGTATGVLNNGGVFTNNAAYNGNVTNGGTIANTAAATWTGNVISNTPVCWASPTTASGSATFRPIPARSATT
jgi:hypothetical protein